MEIIDERVYLVESTGKRLLELLGYTVDIDLKAHAARIFN